MDVDAVEVFKENAHFAKARMKGLGEKLDVARGVAVCDHALCHSVHRLDAEGRAVVDHAECPRPCRRRQCLRVFAVLRLWLIRLRQAFARSLKGYFIRVRCNAVGA